MSLKFIFVMSDRDEIIQTVMLTVKSLIQISPEKKKRRSHHQNVQSVEMIRIVIVCDVIHGEHHVICCEKYLF